MDALVPNAPGGIAFGRCTRKGYAANTIGQDVQVPGMARGSGEGAKAPSVAQSALRERACRTLQTYCLRALPRVASVLVKLDFGFRRDNPAKDKEALTTHTGSSLLGNADAVFCRFDRHQAKQITLSKHYHLGLSQQPGWAVDSSISRPL